MGQYVRVDKLKGGKVRYYLVESHREGKKVVQKRLKYLGTEPPEGWRPKKGEEGK
ncbi:MAG: hypothetical protein KJ624_04790 [Chloroflexi bacterium]|nr:hypothetical protein [Chloroflexota bacterium]